jgi:hypothetical protein
MARRAAYTQVVKENQVREPHVRGMGDVLFRGFQCLNPKCQHWITMRDSDIGEDFDFACPACKFTHKSGEEVKFYDYKLVRLEDDELIEDGEFVVLIDDYVSESGYYKYCIVCNTLKPLDLFDAHAARNTGRQGECNHCKTLYNSIKNQSRIADQHREASQKRRLYVDITGSEKINSKAIRDRFENKCFKCECDLSDPRDGHLDHTLPVSYLWPLTTNNATLLCDRHNGEKSGKWPSQYYSAAELKRLALTTGIDHAILAGNPHVNPEALQHLKDPSFVDNMLAKYAHYMDEMIKVRNRIIKQSGFDFFSISKAISPDIVKKADQALK